MKTIFFISDTHLILLMFICNTEIEQPSLFEVVVPPYSFPLSLFEKFLHRTDTLYIDFKGDAFSVEKSCSYFMIFSLSEFKNLIKNKVIRNGTVIIDNLFILNYKCKSLDEKKECYSLLWENIYKKQVNIFILSRYKDGETILYDQVHWDFLISYRILVEKNELKIIKK